MRNSNISSKIIFSHTPEKALREWIETGGSRKVFLVTEDNVDRLWGAGLSSFWESGAIQKLIIPSGEANKKLESVAKIWEFLSAKGADRTSLLINMGGGMLTDLAGFAASTFKRGIGFINIPTTLLSQVDASVGGKTGINFSGLKNEVGTFREPVAVIINSNFLKTLDRKNLLSGVAEMIKHGLIKDPAHLEEIKTFDFEKTDYNRLQEIIRHSVEVKKFFVHNDPFEKNIRKALNFGHTAGHALESLSFKQNRPVLHGYAVAWGMIPELYLSVIKCGFDQQECDNISRWLLKIFGQFRIENEAIEQLYEWMTHDKKNEGGRINFTLLREPGQIEINQDCEKKAIFEALEYFRSLCQ